MYDPDGVPEGSPQTFAGPHAQERLRRPGGTDETGLVVARTSPILHAFVAAVALALAALLVVAATPGEERRLVYQGQTVGAADLCETTGADGGTVTRACAELGTWETHPTGWNPVPIIVALALAAGAGYEIYQLPKLVKNRRQRLQQRVDRAVERNVERT